MDYISISFYIFLFGMLVLYYLFPPKSRWKILLYSSIIFYILIAKEAIIILGGMILVSWGTGLLISRLKERKDNKLIEKTILIAAIIVVISPLFITKYWPFIFNVFEKNRTNEFIIPLGISFYSLQIISYLIDIYNGKEIPEKSLGKYILFATFFPQIIQGPIARYSQMKTQFLQEHVFEEREFLKGLQLIIWGFFLKMMIADKAAIVVNEIFANYVVYEGWYIVLGGVLYSLQLYADFLACVTISQGVAALFGIEVIDNFKQPYGATSVKEFWHRWHISLSTWLRDYVYISLGGNRKGIIAKYFNLLFTFVISGIWHGAGFKYILWGLMHGIYQIMEDVILPIKNYICDRFEKLKCIRKHVDIICTYICVMVAWIVFRADSLRVAVTMLVGMTKLSNFNIFFDGSIINLGLSKKQIIVLVISVGIMFLVSKLQQRMSIRDMILNQNVVVRWSTYIVVILCIMVFGTYGYGFDAQDFIYGGF